VSDYEERLVAPAGWWFGGLAVAFLLAAGVHGGGTGPRAVVPYVLFPLLALAALVWASRGRVRVAEQVLDVPGARVPLSCTGDAQPLDRESTRRVRGPLADPRAYVVVRPWLHCAVRVDIDDPDDDTPYWLIGTRRPDELAARVSSAARRDR
jgi:hypothetical protein